MSNCADCPKKQAWAAPRRDVPLTGIFNVDKPPGMTSHDVVDAVRRMAGQRKVGHAGTLDPMATGVLLLCLGQATRISEYLMVGRKRYRATVVFGTETDTYDAEGKVVQDGGRVDFDWREIEAALAAFRGPIQQVPPIYSALKRGGRPLHHLARQGASVELEPRPVEIYELELFDWTPPEAIVEVACSSGTYVRALARDLGRHLSSYAHLGALVRLRSGSFTLAEAVSLGRLEEAFRHGEEAHYLLPPDEALLEWTAMVLSADDARRVVHGQAVGGEPPLETEGPLRRAYTFGGDFLAIMSYEPGQRRWRPKKVFATTDESN